MSTPPLELDLQAIKKLATLLKKSGLTEIEYEAHGVRIRVGQNRDVVMTPAATLPAMTHPISASHETQEEPEAVGDLITSPLVGVVYLTPAPGAEPFVSVGRMVKEGEQLLIVEAMKVMNPIRAPRAGRITKIFVHHGQPIEFGEHLVAIDPVGQ